jgi:predicted transcriptional regulator
LSIKPIFAEAILQGVKRYEFRRSIFTRPVDVVLVYASTPVQRVLAEFDVRSIITESVETLWELTKSSAGIDEELFYRYFAGRNYGHAIEIGEVRPYKIPFCPIEYLGIHPPQSFAYVNPYFEIQSDLRSVQKEV